MAVFIFHHAQPNSWHSCSTIIIDQIVGHPFYNIIFNQPQFGPLSSTIILDQTVGHPSSMIRLFTIYQLPSFKTKTVVILPLPSLQQNSWPYIIHHYFKPNSWTSNIYIPLSWNQTVGHAKFTTIMQPNCWSSIITHIMKPNIVRSSSIIKKNNYFNNEKWTCYNLNTIKPYPLWSWYCVTRIPPQVPGLKLCSNHKSFLKELSDNKAVSLHPRKSPR